VKLEIPSKNIVPGDIVILEAGDMIVADGRILHSNSLQVNF
jgi:Ca2+-transporting ATPase